MLQSEQIEELIALVSCLDRDALVWQFNHYPSQFPVDFSEQFLSEQPVDRLRHLFLALCLQSQRMPEVPELSASSQAA